MIVATAGHVDHGKTSLVRALTGTDTDRLPEEKRRGLTIDLGFAYLPLAGGTTIGFVDVPGHERLVHNMLAGVAGVDFALFVVAADDGPMPQTREHLAILDLLGVSRGAAVLTKIDRVSAARVHEVRRDIEALLAPTRLARAPVLPVSTVTNEGLEPLRRLLAHAAQETGKREAEGHFRLSVDRCFTLPGAGLVVTGTAISGEVAAGAEVRALLAGTRARVRSLHAQNTPAARGRAGQRLALNLAGLEGKVKIARGDWVVAGPLPPPVVRADARLTAIADAPLMHWTPVHVHIGAADVMGRIAVLGQPAIAPGAAGLVQLVLERPVGALRGDGFIVRDQSARRTLGGGVIIDVFPPARGRARSARLAELAALALEEDDAALRGLLALRPAGVDLAQFAANRNLRSKAALLRVPMRTAGGRGFSPAHWSALCAQARSTLAAWHARHPEAAGPPDDRILERGLPREAVRGLADALVREGAIVREGNTVRLPEHRASLGAADMALWRRLQPLLQRGALRPPTLAELAEQLRLDTHKVEAALTRAARQRLVVRVSKNRFFLPAMLEQLKETALAEALAAGTITAAAFRDRAGIGRGLAIEVLEYFDRARLTRRVGDARIWLQTGHGRDSHPGGAHGLQIR